jgi:alpha-D-ribose 1-methylphosphonate 5-triphosphate synthase subunit PhnG
VCPACDGIRILRLLMPDDHPYCDDCTANFLWAAFTGGDLPPRCHVCKAEVRACACLRACECVRVRAGVRVRVGSGGHGYSAGLVSLCRCIVAQRLRAMLRSCRTTSCAHDAVSMLRGRSHIRHARLVTLVCARLRASARVCVSLHHCMTVL